MPLGFCIAKSLRMRQLSCQSLRYVTWTRSSTTVREGSPQSDATRRIVRLIAFPTLATNSSHAPSSQGPMQRQTSSGNDNDEYCLGLLLLGILIADSHVGSDRCFLRHLPQPDLPSVCCCLELPQLRKRNAGYQIDEA